MTTKPKTQRLRIRTVDEKSKNPFKAHPDWQHNACMNNPVRSENSVTTSLQYWELGDYFVRAADALVQDVVDDRSLLDVYVSPLVFLYRQGVELFLKDLLWQSHYLASGKKAFIKDRDFLTHDLLKLWQQVKANCQKGLDSAFRSRPRDVEMLEQLLRQIREHDPRSDSFRFPFDTKGNVSHASLSYVNVRSLYESIHQGIDLLGKLRRVLMDAYVPDRGKRVGEAVAQNDGPPVASECAEITNRPSPVR